MSSFWRPLVKHCKKRIPIKQAWVRAALPSSQLSVARFAVGLSVFGKRFGTYKYLLGIKVSKIWVVEAAIITPRLFLDSSVRY